MIINNVHNNEAIPKWETLAQISKFVHGLLAPKSIWLKIIKIEIEERVFITMFPKFRNI